MNFDDEKYGFSINCCIERRPKLCKKIKLVKVEQIYSHMRSSQVPAFHIVVSCGFEKSAEIPADIIRNCGLVKLIGCDSRVVVARNNASYVNNEIRVRSKSILRGNTLLK